MTNIRANIYIYIYIYIYKYVYTHIYNNVIILSQFIQNFASEIDILPTKTSHVWQCESLDVLSKTTCSVTVSHEPGHPRTRMTDDIHSNKWHLSKSPAF